MSEKFVNYKLFTNFSGNQIENPSVLEGFSAFINEQITLKCATLSVYINEEIEPKERLVKLNNIAIHQMTLLICKIKQPKKKAKAFFLYDIKCFSSPIETILKRLQTSKTMI